MTNADKSKGAGVLITGGGGFVGGYLKAHLGALGERVWTGVLRDEVGDDASAGDLDNRRNRRDRRVKLNVRDGAAVQAVFTELRPREVYHLAGVTRPAMGQLADFYDVNFWGTLNVLEAAAEIGAAVLVVSSAYVYGAQSGALAETTLPNPVNHYGASKLAAEFASLPYALSGGRVVRVRPL